jgi:nitronate monooxygenase
MAITTRFTKLVGCDVPIQWAGMGAASTPELAAAVSNAGGLGMLSATADDLVADIDAVERAAPGRPFGVNFLMPFFDRAVLDTVAPRVPLGEWYWSQPDPVLVGVAHDAGALAAWQVGSVDEALAGVDPGCDLIVAQGIEAGGHVRGTIGLLPLLDGVLEAVDVPVVATGGSAPPAPWPRSSPPARRRRGSARASSPPWSPEPTPATSRPSSTPKRRTPS